MPFKCLYRLRRHRLRVAIGPTIEQFCLLSGSLINICRAARSAKARPRACICGPSECGLELSGSRSRDCHSQSALELSPGAAASGDSSTASGHDHEMKTIVNDLGLGKCSRTPCVTMQHVHGDPLNTLAITAVSTRPERLLDGVTATAFGDIEQR